jgi:hypothetical protein
MAGGRSLLRRFAAAVSASLLALTGVVQAQDLFPSGHQTGMEESQTVGPEAPATQWAAPSAVFNPECCPGVGESAACDKTCCGVIGDSLFGDTSLRCWSPLTLDSFFSEGWDEAWVGGPAGESGLTPRHGWLGSFEGVFYRLWLVNGTYQHNLNKSFGGNGYGANFTTFLPLNRRFELFVNAPMAANGTDDPTQGYRSDFGDFQIAGSFLLSETKSFTQLITIGATLPTGTPETGGGLTTVFPRYSFWSNPTGAWVVRGGAGVNVPVNETTAQTSLAGDLAVGRYLTPHNVPLGDLVFYLNCNVSVPVEGSGQANVGVGPGTRFQINGNWYFLHYWEFQAVRSNQPFDYQMQTAIVKAW